MSHIYVTATCSNTPLQGNWWDKQEFDGFVERRLLRYPERKEKFVNAINMDTFKLDMKQLQVYQFMYAPDSTKVVGIEHVDSKILVLSTS